MKQVRSEWSELVREFYSEQKRAGRFKVESRDWSEWLQEDHRNEHIRQWVNGCIMNKNSIEMIV